MMVMSSSRPGSALTPEHLLPPRQPHRDMQREGVMGRLLPEDKKLIRDENKSYFKRKVKKKYTNTAHCMSNSILVRFFWLQKDI